MKDEDEPQKVEINQILQTESKAAIPVREVEQAGFYKSSMGNKSLKESQNKIQPQESGGSSMHPEEEQELNKKASKILLENQQLSDWFEKP